MTTMITRSSSRTTDRWMWDGSQLLGQLLRSISRHISLQNDRKFLAEMPDYLLRDIGISRWEIDEATRFGRSRVIDC